MRNPFFIGKYSEMICDYNFSPTVLESLKDILPCDKDKLFFHSVIEEWGPALKVKIPAILASLEAAGN
jgi:hypothetical protein